MDALIETGCDDADGGDFSGYTPLTWVAHIGHAEVMEILLGHEEVNAGEPDNLAQTLISHATSPGREEAVQILLRREVVDPERPDNFGET